MDRVVRLAILADIREASERLDRIGARVDTLTAKPHTIKMQMAQIPSSDLRSAEAQADLSGRRIGTRLTTSMKGVIEKAGPAAIGGLAVGFGEAIKQTIEFQSSMEKVKNLVGVSGKSLDYLSNGVLNLAKVSGVGPKELADALYYVASAGFRGKAAMDVMTVSAKAAAAGLGSTKDVADAVTSALNAYHGSGLKASQVTDTLVAAVREGKMPVDALAGAIGPLMGVSAQLGVKFSEVAGAAAALSRSGVPVNKTMTGLRFLLSSLANPSAQAAKVLGSVGLSAADLRKEIAERGLLATLETLKKKLPIQEFMQVTGGARGLTTALGLVGKNAGQVRGVMDRVAHSAGATDKAFQGASESVEFKFHKAMASLTAVGIQLGTTLLPVLSSILGVVAKLAGNKAALVAFSIALGVVAGAWVAVKVAALASAIAENAALLFIPAAIALVIAAIVLLVTHWKTVKRWFVDVWEWLKAHEWVTLFFPIITVIIEITKHWRGLWTFLKALWASMKADWKILCNFFSSNWNATYKAIVGAWHTMNKTWDSLMGSLSNRSKIAWDYIKLAGLTAVDYILKAFSHIPFIGHYFASAEHEVHGWMGTIQGDINRLNGKVVNIGANFKAYEAAAKRDVRPGGAQEFHAAGGIVRGMGTETSDSVPIWASRNEYVVTAAAHRYYGTDFLDRVNNRRFAGGGAIELGVRSKLSPDSSSGIYNAIDNVVLAMASKWAKNYWTALNTFASGVNAGNLLQVARWLIAHGGATRAAAAGIAGTIAGESGGNPESVGSGGFGLIGWTGNTIGLPAGYTGPTGRPAYDMAVQTAGVLGYIRANGGMGPINSAGAAGGPQAAARIFSSAYERPLVTYSDIRPSVVSSIYSQLAMARGGIINEPVFGIGLSGTAYTFGESGPELVAPLHGPGTRKVSGTGVGAVIIINFNGVVTDPDATARKIHQILRDYKRHKGNQPLGIA